MVRTVARPRLTQTSAQRGPRPLALGHASTILAYTQEKARPIQPITQAIPLEILGALLEHIDNKHFLLQCRLLCREFKCVADPWAFRTLVSRDQKNREGYLSIANMPEISIYAKDVKIRTYGQGVDSNDETNGGVISDIGVITKFAHINALQLLFQSDWVEYEPDKPMSPARRLQIVAIKVLADLHSNCGLQLQQLTIHDLISRPNKSILTAYGLVQISLSIPNQPVHFDCGRQV